MGRPVVTRAIARRRSESSWVKPEERELIEPEQVITPNPTPAPRAKRVAKSTKSKGKKNGATVNRI